MTFDNTQQTPITMNDLTTEQINFLRGMLLVEIKENTDRLENLERIWHNNPEWFYASPTHNEVKERGDLLASTLCTLERQLDVLEPARALFVKV